MSTKRGKPDELLTAGYAAAAMLNESWPGVRAVAALIDDLHTCGAAIRRIRRDSKLPDRQRPRKKSDEFAEVAELLASINRRARRYHSRFLLMPWPPRMCGLTMAAINPSRAADVWYIVSRLLERDQLGRLRRCGYKKCRKWLFAGRRSDRKFCDSQCRFADIDGNARLKRQLQKQREEAALRQAVMYKGARKGRSHAKK